MRIPTLFTRFIGFAPMLALLLLGLLFLDAGNTGVGSAQPSTRQTSEVWADLRSTPDEPIPPGTHVETVLSNMYYPIAMAFDSAGRLFYTEKTTGNVRLFANGQLQPNPVITLAVNASGERGLLGIAIDPNFATNHYIWVYRTNPSPLTNQVVRFEEHNGVGINATVVFTTPLLSATNHNGGNLHFGPDGKLYVTIGENAVPANSQSGNTPLGHLHRFNPTAPLTAPPDNPYYNYITVTVKSIWTFGNRNSFDFDFDPLSPWMFFSENGPNCDDELNRGVGGYNYGWRSNYPCDDPNPDPQYNTIPPLWFLPLGQCCVAPTGVAFYTGGQIPAWQNELFMCSYNDGWLRHFYLSPDRRTVTSVAQVTGIACNTAIQTGPDGAFYYIQGGGYGIGTLKRVVADATPTPTATRTPTQTPTPTSTPINTPTPTPSTFTFTLATTGVSDIALPLDVSPVITDAESLAVYIETQGGSPPGSIQQLLKWNAPGQSFMAWSHQFGYGDNFATLLGDYIFLLANGGPASVTFTGRRPAPGELYFSLAPGQPSPSCAMNFLSLPLDHPEITNADQLSDSIGTPSPPGPATVLQALDWDISAQNFMAWSNEFNFGDNFVTIPGYPYIVCVTDTAPPTWP